LITPDLFERQGVGEEVEPDGAPWPLPLRLLTIGRRGQPLRCSPGCSLPSSSRSRLFRRVFPLNPKHGLGVARVGGAAGHVVHRAGALGTAGALARVGDEDQAGAGEGEGALARPDEPAVILPGLVGEVGAGDGVDRDDLAPSLHRSSTHAASWSGGRVVRSPGLVMQAPNEFRACRGVRRRCRGRGRGGCVPSRRR
jgi:hypothetical protein